MIKANIFLIFLILAYSLHAQEDPISFYEERIRKPKEENFLYVSDLNFKVSKNSSDINFNEIHNNLKDFEKKCTEVYKKEVEKICLRLNISTKENINKNISVFAVSILLKDKDGNIRKVTSTYDELLFISGIKNPTFKRDDLPSSEIINYLKIDDKEIEVRSLKKSYEGFYKRNSRNYISYKEYFQNDLCTGWDDKYNGIFSQQENGDMFIHKTITDVLNEGDISIQFKKIRFKNENNWCGSLVDSEQSIRIYFQEHCKDILTKLIQDSFLKPREIVSGIILHIHSHLDICELCNASLIQMMNVCNKHHKDKERQLLLSKSYLLEQFNNIDVQGYPPLKIDKNFRFRIMASSRQPYKRYASLWLSRRNWCGKGNIEEKQDLNFNNIQPIDYINNDYIFHKIYSG